MSMPDKSQTPPSAALQVVKDSELAIVRARVRSEVPATIEDVKDKAIAARTTFDGMAAPTMRMVASVHGHRIVQVTATAVITSGMGLIAQSRRLSPEQVGALAEEIITRWPRESLEDINVFVRGVATGKYEGSAIYSILDLPRMLSWWEEYLSDKALQMELNAGRAEDVMEQGMKATISQHDTKAISMAVRDFVIDAKERSEHIREQKRVATLKAQLPKMDLHALREAWKVYRTMTERSMIQAEAARKGYLGEEHQQAQYQVDAGNGSVSGEQGPDQLAQFVEGIKSMKDEFLSVTRKRFEKAKPEEAEPWIKAIDAEFARRAQGIGAAAESGSHSDATEPAQSPVAASDAPKEEQPTTIPAA